MPATTPSPPGRADVNHWFVDSLGKRALHWLKSHAAPHDIVWQFRDAGEPADVSPQSEAEHSLGLAVRPVPFNVIEMRSEKAGTLYYSAVDDATALEEKIVEDLARETNLLRAVPSEWSAPHVKLHLRRWIADDVRLEVLRIHLISFLARQEDIPLARVRVLVSRRPWARHLVEFAHRRGVLLQNYGGSGGQWFPETRRIAADGLRAVSRMFKRFGRRRAAPMPSGVPAEERSAPKSRVAIHYNHRSLSLDPHDRTEFFWLHDSGIASSDVVLYGVGPPTPPSREAIAAAKETGMHLYGNGPGLAPWAPTRGIIRDLIPPTLRILAAAAMSWPTRRRIPSAYVMSLLRLGFEFAWWRDFFKAQRVRLHVGTFNTPVSQVVALQSLDALSCSYQFSLSSLPFTSDMTSGEDIRLAFSTYFEDLWQSIPPLAREYVTTGFVFDRGLRYHAGRKSGEVRQRMETRGVRYVLCFFDENTKDLWYYPATVAAAAEDYKFLFRWLEEDPSFGLVLKPKFAATLFERMPELKPLYDRAKATGRCELLATAHHVSEIFPIEAALEADVCVGKIRGGTAALEAALAGIPTLLIDVEGFRSHPFHEWGRNRVVFEDWAALRRAVEQQRTRPGRVEGFGDWSSAKSDVDPFGDGEGTLRLGATLGWIHQALGRGLSGEEAIAYARAKFAERWTTGPRRTGQIAGSQNNRPRAVAAIPVVGKTE